MSFTLPTFGDLDDLLFRLNGGRRDQQVVFLVGSALTAPAEVGSPGVPGVAGVLQLIREEFGADPEGLEKLEATLAEEPSESYQRAFDVLLKRCGPGLANRVIRRAVLQARVVDEPIDAALEGETAACSDLEKDGDGWALRSGVEALGQIAAAFPETFGQMILTPNFDPLIEVAIQRAGGTAYRTVLHGDVVHVHGHCRFCGFLTIVRSKIDFGLSCLESKALIFIPIQGMAHHLSIRHAESSCLALINKLDGG